MGFLFSDLTSEGFWSGIGIVLAALAAAVVTIVTALRKGSKEKRADAIAEWQKYSAKMESELQEAKSRFDEEAQEAKKENANLRRQLHTLRDQHYADTLAIHAKLAACEKDKVEQHGEIKLLQMAVHRVQLRVGDDPPAVSTPCLIIAETDGVIRDASPSTGPILEWLSVELIGRNIEVIVPEDLRDLHRAALARIQSRGVGPWTDRTILTEALTKSGRRVKVSVRVKGWQTGGGHWLLSGEISERQS